MGETAQRQELFDRLKLPIYLFLIGLILVALGILSFRFFEDLNQELTVEVIEPSDLGGVIMVDLGGAVLKPGVYELEKGARINDLLIRAGGLSAKADRDWVAKNLNLADEVVDGQKYYVPFQGEETKEGLIDINSASLSQLESLEGIGEKRARDIVDNRPYSSIDELVDKEVISKIIFDKIQEKISVY